MLHRLAQVGQEIPALVHAVHREHHRDAGPGDLAGVEGGHFPMLHLLQRNEARQVGVRHVDGRGEIQRHDDRPTGRRHLIEPAVGVAPTEEGVLHSEFVADQVGPQDVAPVPGLEEVGQIGRRVECLEGKVAFLGGLELTVPFRIAEGLAQQGDAAHEGARIGLSGGALGEAVPRRHTGFEHSVMRVIG